MNHFVVDGVVRLVRVMENKRGSWHLLIIETSDNEEVGVPCFGSPPLVGDDIRVEGRLSSSQTHLRLKVETMQVIKESRERAFEQIHSHRNNYRAGAKIDKDRQAVCVGHDIDSSR